MKRKILFVTVLTVLILGGVVYAGGVSHYANVFYPGSRVNGTEIGECSAEEVEGLLSHTFDDYELTVIGRESVDVIQTAQIGLRIDIYDESGENLIQKVLDGQGRFLWPLVLIRKESGPQLTFGLTYDEDLLRGTVENLQCTSPDTVREASDAYLSYEEGKYQIIGEVTGNTADAEAVLSLVRDAVQNGTREITLEDDLYDMPTVWSDDETLHAQADAVNRFLSCDITIRTAHHTAVLDGDVIWDFLVIGEDGSVDLDEEAVGAWVEENVVEPNNSVGITRTVESAGSGTFQISGGNYGNVVDAEAEKEQVLRELRHGTVVDRQPICTQSEQSLENGGVGSNFIDVDLGSQMVYLIEENQVTYSTACVSGKVSDGHATPTGVYYVSWKTQNWTMKKYHVTVKYWMPINDSTGVGLHDASWRKKFGGTIYQKDGSHGCINLPPEAAKYLYENTSVGIPVVVH